MPRISVVIPSYNHQDYIAQGIQSVLDQTFQDFEVVITDDGSQDKTVEIIKNFSDPRIRVFRFDGNRGACAAINNCIQAAEGEFISVLNSDDLFLQNKLEKQVSFLDENKDIGAVFGLAQFINEEGKDFLDPNHPYFEIFKQPNRSRFEWLNRFFYVGNCLCHPSVLVRKKCYEAVGLYDERLAQLPDLDFWIRLCMKYEIFIIPENLIKFRIRKGEMNVSGQSQGARFRQTGEYIQVLNNYLNIKSEDEFFKVFPEGKKFDKSFDPSLVPFFISMLALEKGSALHKYFAILTLFELLSKPEMSKKIQENYGFSFVDFHKITGKYDLFDISVIQKKEEAIREKNRQIEQKDIQIFQLQQALGRIYGSLGWKLIMRCRDVQDFLLPFRTRRRKIYDMFLRNSKIIFNQGFGIFFKKAKDQFYQRYLPKIFYKLWILKYEPDRGQLRVMQEESKKWVVRPKVSIVTPVFNPNQYDLTQCIQSVLDQIYDNWELCLADGGSNKPHVRKVLEKFSKADPRIKFVSLPENRGIVGNSNEGLKLANGEFVGFLDHDDMLAPFALYEVVKSLNSNPATDFFFSDEDKITPKGKYRYDPYFKPDWSPDMLLSYNYACHFVVVRKKIIDEIGGFREGFDGSQDYDLILRITKKTSNIKRIPKILYHWRAAQTSVASDPKAKPYAYLAAKKAIKEYSEWRGYNVEVLDGVSLGAYRVKYAIKAPGRVCIIIPTKDKVQLLKKCVSSVLEKTDYPDFEILIVDNQSQEPATFDYFGSLKGEERIKVLNYNHPFNFSGINNFAAAATDAEYLLFLNNDTEVINSDWLTSMLEFAQREDVGAVGARLYYSNHTIQHAGLIIGILGLAGHAHRDFPGTSSGYKGRIKIIQNVSAVTAACMMVRKKVFDEVGGFDEALINAFNDVDLCLKIREKGYLIVYTPFAELYHHESISRGPDTTRAGLARFDKEVKIVKTRWKHVLDSGDPYYNPNLTLEKENFEIKL